MVHGEDPMNRLVASMNRLVASLITSAAVMARLAPTPRNGDSSPVKFATDVQHRWQ